jgi:hypothetical protein
MSSRRIKQFVYGLFFIIVIFIVIAAFYVLFLKPAPSCFDNIQDQGEQGVDCGGPCAKICIPTSTQPISEIGAVDVFAPLADHVTLLAQVVNPNSNFAADTFDYTFNLYDGAGNVIGTVPDSSFIYADQTKYLVVPNQAISGSVDHATLTINPPHWVPASMLGSVPQFTFQNIAATSPATGTVAIGGTVIDADAASFSGLEIIAVLKSSSGAPVGVTETKLDGISPNQPASFSVAYPISAQNINPAATELDAYGVR